MTSVKALIKHLEVVLNQANVDKELFNLIPIIAPKVIPKAKKATRRKDDPDRNTDELLSALILQEIYDLGKLEGFRRTTSVVADAIKCIEKGRLK